MIISSKIKSENDNFKIFEAIKIAFTKLNSNIKNTKGRPRKYSDEQIVASLMKRSNTGIELNFFAN